MRRGGTVDLSMFELMDKDKVLAAAGRTRSDGTCTFTADGSILLCCDKDVETYRVPAGTRAIGPHAFEYRRRLTRIELPEGLEDIGEAAFLACNALVKADFPTTLKHIGDIAFFATKLKSIRIPAGFEFMGDAPFLYMPRPAGRSGSMLAPECAVEVEPGNLRYSTSDGFLLERMDDGRLQAVYYFGPGGAVTIPDGVSRAGAYALTCSVTVDELNIPASLREVGTNGLSMHNHPDAIRLAVGQGEVLEILPSKESLKTRQYVRMFSDGVIDAAQLAKEYDAGLRAMKPTEERTRRIVRRLQNGVLLDGKDRSAFLNLLARDLDRIVERCARSDDVQTAGALCDLGVICRSNMSHAIDVANAVGGVAVCGRLIQASRNMASRLSLDL